MDGKKKKNKKKKGGQSKATEDAATNSDVVVQENDNGYAPEQNHRAPSSSNADTQSIGVSESDMEVERQKVYGAKCTMLQEEVRRLEEERNIWLQREVGLEEQVKHLRDKVHSCLQNEAMLEEKLNHLQIRHDSLTEKEAILEDKVKHIEDIKVSWNLKEISMKEMIARVEEANILLQMQVKELEDYRNGHVQENQKLMQSISALESRTEHLEKEASFNKSSAVITQLPEEKNLLYRMEEVVAPMEKPDAKHAGLLEKVNDLYIEPDQHAITSKHSSTTKLNHVTTPIRSTAPMDYVSEYGERACESSEKIQSLVSSHEIYGIPNGVADFVAANRIDPEQPLNLDESRISEEIVQIPLDDIQVQEADLQAIESDESTGVPLSDAPLIGAPFRLISFVAKFISGADLVNQGSSQSRQ